ncbi:prephenate dehydrogenase [Candidatus Woesearchaeota archaeon]|nr:prephenate dehydrogenase [Candidatus Woesearchaeota archaeon]
MVKAAKKSLGIIGRGRFGRLAERLLSRHFRTLVYDLKREECTATLEEAAASDIVLLCVHASSLEDAVRQIRPHVRKGALVMDVCSVKEYPAGVLRKGLPQADLISTHPLFGPDSYSRPGSRRIVLCPVRISQARLKKVKDFMAGLGLRVMETTPEEHDRQAAFSLALIHAIGRSFPSGAPEIKTMNSELMAGIKERVESDSYQLFLDMLRYNRFARPALIGFGKRIMELAGKNG